MLLRYWQSNMNNVKANKTAHKESVRDLRLCFTIFLFVCMDVLIYLVYFLLNSFCRTDLKFCSCSDDTTVKVWDFARCQEERSLTGNVSNLLPALVYFFCFLPIYFTC